MLKIYQLRRSQNTFEVTMKYRGVSVRVAFVDGNNYRDIPAKCYTRDPFKQRAIEASQMYQDKEIVLERTIEEEGERKEATQKKPAGEPAGTVAGGGQSRGVNEKAAGEPAGTVAGAGAQMADDGMEKKVFDNLAEAIVYIATNYQVQVQTANEARNFLKEKGIKATIKQG